MINYHILYTFFKKSFFESLIWYQTYIFKVGSYIFVIVSFVFQGQVVASFIQTCFYNSQFCRFSFMYVPTSPECISYHLSSLLHVVIDDLTSSVVFSALYKLLAGRNHSYAPSVFPLTASRVMHTQK